MKSVLYRRSGVRRGQTLILALGVMFLLLILGGIFVTLITQNLGRVDITRGMSRAETLALAGLQFVQQQLLTSREGADWRPVPTEVVWRQSKTSDASVLNRRQYDPDYPWLGADLRRPFVRFHTRDGRFLVRLTLEPRFRTGLPTSAFRDQFDPNSMFLHIESVGRPGVVDEKDPSTLRDPTRTGFRLEEIVGEWRKLDAWAPVGLTDQLWWVTNRSNRRGPAQLGVPPFRDGNDFSVRYNSEYFGSILVNGDLEWVGRNTLHIFPARGEAVQVRGRFLHRASGSEPAEVNVLREDDTPGATAEEDNQDDSVRTVLASIPEGPTGSAGYNPILLLDGRALYADQEYLTQPGAGAEARSSRGLAPPSLDAPEAATQLPRYEALTRESGRMATVTVDGDTRTVNLGLYGLGRGLYLDNYTDIQYSADRNAVIDEWLQRGAADVRRTGWDGFQYVPSVRDEGTVHPILELQFLPDGIQATRFDRDVRGHNFGRAAGRTRLFYQIDPVTGLLAPVGQTAVFPYPENGVVCCAGSVRVRGLVGGPGAPRQLTLVSGGTIYIEGNLLKGHPNSYLALLARDNVCLNPTAFFRFQSGDDVVLDADLFQPGQDPTSFHFTVPQGSHMDVATENAETVDPSQGYLLHVRHSAGTQDISSRTDVSLYLQGLSLADRYDFGKFLPPYPSAGAGPSDFGYHFLFYPPGSAPGWAYSNHQSSTGGTANYEQKTFFLQPGGNPGELRLLNTPGETVSLRWFVDPIPDGQPYWLSRAALIPQGKPLRIEIDALIYAQEGSWFVIPTPWFNDNTADTRQLFLLGDPATGRSAGTRAAGTYPENTDDYPFAHEPLNIQIVVNGTITENMPVEIADRVAWTNRHWLDTAVHPVSPGYAPNIRYSYDHNLRRYVRYRFVDTGEEGVAYVGPVGAQIAHTPQAPMLENVMQAAFDRGTYVVTLPLLPNLPAGPIVYQGNPL
ncbi:MAG: hypothetical protein HY320_04460 [Armatimonadetes bacterium]|nr:hypothetical protein [Armatimonadota bacterium]